MLANYHDREITQAVSVDALVPPQIVEACEFEQSMLWQQYNYIHQNFKTLTHRQI